MSTASLLIGFALLAVALWIAGAPLLRQNHRLRTARPLRESGDRAADRAAVLVALRDLDFDHQLGKVGDDDYAVQRGALLLAAASAPEDGRPRPSAAPMQAAVTGEGARRPGSAAPARKQRRTCLACGAVLRPGDLFCVVCGEPAGSACAARACPTCTRVARPDELFCPVCGTALAPARQPTEAVRP